MLTNPDGEEALTTTAMGTPRPAAGIGKITRKRLRDVWKHEAIDFTRWLEQNLDVLNDALDITLINAERERPIGDFSLDLSAEEEGTGRLVVIENQLDRSNHDHLGKLLTYLASVEQARVAIWIVSDPRPEHVQAISWLNASVQGTEFYLLKVEAIAIGDSTPAPLFTRIVGPSEATRQARETRTEIAERHKIRRDFWTALLERARERTRLHSAIKPGIDNWIGTGAGRSGLAFNYVTTQHVSRVELYIDTGDQRKNKAIFDALFANRAGIESAFGGALVWQRLDQKRAARVLWETTTGGYRDAERWPAVHEAIIDAMIRLEAAIRPQIAMLPS